MSYYGKEDELRHKYDPIPEEPRHRKKRKKKHVRSDHKHEYEQVCVDAHTKIHRSGEQVGFYYTGTRCRICGRIGDLHIDNITEPPKGMRLFEVADFRELWGLKVLPDAMEVKR